MSLWEQVPLAVKGGAAAVVAVGAIVGGAASVDSWAQNKTNEAVARSEAKQALIHDVQFQLARMQYNESQLKITELELQGIEEELAYKRNKKIEITTRELMTVERLRRSLTFYDGEMRDAQTNLTEIQERKEEGKQ